MSTSKQKLSYYRLRLQELLNTSFPELAWDEAFIARRSQLAGNAYEGAFKAGNTIEYSSKIADYILFEGLHFSRFDTVFKVVCTEFDTIMADQELYPFALKMFPVCQDTFLGYTLSDDFGSTAEFDVLYTELTGTIQLWIEENGLQ